MPFVFTGSSAVLSRTVFTNNGPIVKAPLPLSSGADLYIESPNSIRIASGNFNQTIVGKTVTISGSPGGVNDGLFHILSVKSFNVLVTDGNFNFTDPAKILGELIVFANSFKEKYNAHLNSSVHGSPDLINIVTAQNAVDIVSVSILLNDIKTKLGAHSVLTGAPPQVHKFADPDASIFANNASTLASAIILANSLRARYEFHRQDRGIHLDDDFINRLIYPNIKAYTGTGSLIGPFNWIISDPRYGTVADSPSDVTVLVNSVPAAVEYVYGLLGAIVLQTAPVHGDTVLVDYKYLKNPPTQLQRLNSWEFYLNQEGNKGKSGYYGHLYRQRSYLLNPGDPRLLKSPIFPEKIGYKFKGYELAYSARLNDPSSLLLNSPTNKLLYTVYDQDFLEQIIRWDPITLPNTGVNPWNFYGDGTTTLILNPPSLEIKDNTKLYGSDPGPPFYSYPINLTFPSHISTAFRFYSLINDDTVPEEDFYGVGFGVNLGSKSALFGILKTDANNLSSAISLVNSLKSSYTSHIDSVGVHQPLDTVNVVTFVDATDELSLVNLTNQLVSLYLAHLNEGPNDIHKNPDLVNTVSSVPVFDLATSIAILNNLRLAFNSHLVQNTVHFVNDNLNSVDRIKQAGLLTSRGFIESQYSYNSFAYDWTVETTYRLYVDPNGNASVYLSGDVSPRCSVNLADMPDSADLDLRFDPVYQVYFGSFADNGGNVSYWRFIRVDVNPVNSVQILKNKFVSYDNNQNPELNPNFPWINVGQGNEIVIAPNTLMVDSLSSIRDPDAVASGIITGEYRGYLRVEPSITDRNLVTFEFTASSPFFSHGVNNTSLSVNICDGNFATQLCFLQANPTAANVIGTIYQPSISISTGDNAVFSINEGELIVVTSPSNIITASGVVNLINSVVGFAFASIYTNPFSGALTVQLTSPTIGASSFIRIVSGQIFDKLGIQTGVFIYGSDSKPEAKLSYSGLDLPDLDNPSWSVNGNQSSYMRERTLIIKDDSTSDYRSYIQSNDFVTIPVFNPLEDWKTDFRVKVTDFTIGSTVTSTVNFNFCGVLFNVDEGPTGKNLELHYSKDLVGSPCLVLYSFDPNTSTLDYKAHSVLAWNDGEFHSISIYTDKVSSLISIFADGLLLFSFNYSLLNDGVYGPSTTFGSGSNPVSNGDLTTAKSTTEWTSVCAIHDSTVNNSYLAGLRYVGLYRGGDNSKLSSYYLAPIDWKNNHTYRLVRDPISGVTVFIDGAAIPSISASYDVLTLPLSTLDFLSGVVPASKLVSWGSFNSHEIVRSIWSGDTTYSVGRLTDNDNIIPPHQVLNYANVVASPDHLFTKKPHQHYGTKIYSGGTPDDDFMNDSTVAATTILGTGTPPFALSQDMTSQGGLDTGVLPLDLINNLVILGSGGSVANFINDVVNIPNASSLITYTTALNNLVSDATTLRSAYLSHITKVLVGVDLFHLNPDLVNNVVTLPVAGNLASCISCITDLITEFNDHRSQLNVHYNDDTLHSSTAPVPTDLASCISSINLLSTSYNDHLGSRFPHIDVGFPISQLSFCIASLNSLRDLLIDHMTNIGGLFHDTSPAPGGDPDNNNANLCASVPYATNLITATILASSLKLFYNSHLTSFGVGLPHTNQDNINLVTAVDPIDEASLLVITNDLITKFALHRINNGVVAHSLVDLSNIFTPNSNNEYLARYVGNLIDLLNQHVMDLGVHENKDPLNQTISSLPFSFNGPNTSLDQDDYNVFVNDLVSKFKNHLLSTSAHLTGDYVNFDTLNSTAPASNFATCMALVVAIFTALADHNNPSLILETQAHRTVDTSNLYPISNNYDPLPVLISNTNELLSKFIDHTIYKPSHVKVDDSYVASTATNLPTSIIILNDLKDSFNNHRVKTGVHVRPDTVNNIVTPDATDLNSAITLFNALLSGFNSHRVLPGVHSSSAIITLSQPSGSLYDGIKFWTINSGTSNITSTFSDDETLYLGSIQNQKIYRLNYQGSHLPNLLSITSSATEPFTNLPGTYLLVYLDYNDPIQVNFIAGDTTAAAVVARINGTVGIPANFASSTSTNSVVLTNPNSTSSKYLQVNGPASDVLGLDTGVPVPWALTSDDSSAVSVAVIPGSPDYLRYRTTGTGTRTAYVASTGLTDGSSVGFSITYRLRINSFTFLPNGETGIYVGCSSNSVQGFTVGIGFIQISSSKAVILKDMNSGMVLGTRVFDWGDGNFHSYTLTKNNLTDSIELSIS